MDNDEGAEQDQQFEEMDEQQQQEYAQRMAEMGEDMEGESPDGYMDEEQMAMQMQM